MSHVNMQVSDFDFISKMNSHSEERNNPNYGHMQQDENMNAINIANVS